MPKKRVDPIIESVTLEPELEEALASATDAELCDIAGNVTTGRNTYWFPFPLNFRQIFHRIVFLHLLSNITKFYSDKMLLLPNFKGEH